jgi:hypothetical protein
MSFYNLRGAIAGCSAKQLPLQNMTEMRVAWEHVFPDDGAKLFVRSNWIPYTESSRAYLDELIKHIGLMAESPACTFECRTLDRDSPAIPADVGRVADDDFYAAVDLARVQQTPSLKAAYRVLVDGVRPSSAARLEGTTPQALNNTLSKLRTAINLGLTSREGQGHLSADRRSD